MTNTPQFLVWGTGPAIADDRESWQALVLIPDEGQPAGHAEFTATAPIRVTLPSQAPIEMAEGDSVSVPYNPAVIWEAAMGLPLAGQPLVYTDPLPALAARYRAALDEIARLRAELAAHGDASAKQ